MTLLCIEGFDHFLETDISDKNWLFGNISFIDVSSTYARFSGQGVKSAQSSIGYIRKNIGVDKSTIYFGIAVKKASALTPDYSTADLPFIGIKDEAGVYQVKLHVLADLSIGAYDGSNSLLGSSSSSVVPSERWFYLEGKITISATVGEVTLRVNETQVLNLTSQDTKNGTDYIRYIEFCSMYNDLEVHFDDFYVDDAQFHGDCRIRTFMPDSISTTNNSFTASAGNKNECVDETLSNEDTDYIYSSTLNHKQGFGITTGALGTVKGIQLNNHCRDDAAGSRKITPLIRSNGTDYSGTESDAITSEYLFESEVWETDPDDSNPWTQTKLEAAEFGLEITT